MVELERAIVRWQAEGTPELRGAVVWRAAQVLWETASLFRRHAGAVCLVPLAMVERPHSVASWHDVCWHAVARCRTVEAAPRSPALVSGHRRLCSEWRSSAVPAGAARMQ